jgi:hypothetical protein
MGPSHAGADAVRLYLVQIAARDELGALARVTRCLADHRINLQGFVVDSAGIQVLTSELTEAATALQEGGFRYSASEVHEVILEDRPGSLAELCERLAAVGINITASFGVATGSAGRIYINVSDLPRAAPILDAMSRGSVVIHARLGRVGGAAPLQRPAAPRVVWRIDD